MNVLNSFQTNGIQPRRTDAGLVKACPLKPGLNDKRALLRTDLPAFLFLPTVSASSKFSVLADILSIFLHDITYLSDGEPLIFDDELESLTDAWINNVREKKIPFKAQQVRYELVII